MGRSNLSRELDFMLKGLLTWARPAAKATAGDFEATVGACTPPERAAYDDLRSRYDIARWPALCTARELRGNLHTLSILDSILGGPLPPTAALDIGALNWWYLPALYAFQPGNWCGVELDAHQRYASMSTRLSHAEWMCARYDDCRYMAADLMDLNGAYGLITWLLPFVQRPPLVAAGLPNRFFRPEAMLAHAWTLLSPGGRMVIVNQNRREASAQAELFEALGIAAQGPDHCRNLFATDGDDDRQAWLATKPSSVLGEDQS